MDRLETMLKMQGDFQQRLDPNFYDKSLKERVAFIKEHSIHLNQEINEMLYELPYFKPWKDYSDMSDEAKQVAMQKARIELIDAWHFFMNLALGLGFTADEFYQMYCMKNAENHRRQDDGYTSDVSYKDQKPEDVLKMRCTISDANKAISSTDFIALVNDNGTSHIFMHTDVTTLGLIASIAQAAYTDNLALLPEEDQTTVSNDVLEAFEKFLEASDE